MSSLIWLILGKNTGNKSASIKTCFKEILKIENVEENTVNQEINNQKG